jgi:hypothetical protein
LQASLYKRGDAWAPNQSDPASLRGAFYRHLQKERPELLNSDMRDTKLLRVLMASTPGSKKNFELVSDKTLAAQKIFDSRNAPDETSLAIGQPGFASH